MSSAADPRALLRRVRRRLVAQALVRNLGAALLLSGGAVLVLATAERLHVAQLWRAPWLAAIPTVLLVAALALALLRAPRLPLLARAVDRLGGTHDRFVTALAFAGAAAPWQASAVRECERFLVGRDFRRLFAWRLPAEWRWLPAVAIALVLVRWETHLQLHREQAAISAAQEKVAPTVAALQQLAQKLATNAEQKRLAEQIARGAQDLQRNARDPATADQAALRELSALEQMVQEMQHRSGVSPEDLQALARSLAAQDPTRAAAKALQAENPAAAAEALEEAAKKLAGDAAAQQQAAAALQEALERIAQQHALSESMKRAGELAAQNGGASEALRQLAQMLRDLPRAGEAPKGATPGSPQDLDRVLAALQNLKFGRPDKPSGQPKSSAEGESGPPILQIAPPSAGGDQPMTAQIPNASGQPGSEHDEGTTDSPFGKKLQEPTNKGADLALRGQQGPQGASISQLLPGGPDASKAKRQYKQLYEAMAPAAEDAVLQEEIPLGSRLFIKRYFDAIRPKE